MRTRWLVILLLVMAALSGCRGDREHPTAATEADHVMESYLANVQKIGSLLAGVSNETQAQAVSNQVLLIVQDMRELLPKMKAFSDKQQADTMSKYRVKINKVNEQFAKDVTRFVTIPGASEELIEQLKSLPAMGESE